MNALHLQNTKEQVVEEGKETFTVAERQKVASPPSSPTHEFSFTVSLQSSSSSKLLSLNDKTKLESTLAVDFSPADDIFFHGHLLPLHPLSHIPVSPRSSTNSLDSFILPIKDLSFEQKPQENSKIDSCSNNINDSNEKAPDNVIEKKGRSNHNFFSLFGLAKRRKGFESKEAGKENNIKQKKKLRLDLSHVLKRYAKMVRPVILFFRWSQKGEQLRNQAYYSYSGDLSSRYNEKYLRGRRGEFSAPVSRRSSPTNSGLLVATTSFPPASDSTMEELQTALQAAIAHCKNSFAVEDERK